MAEKYELAKAYVQIVPSAQGIGGSIEKALSPEADKAGTIAGQKISKAAGSSMQNIGKGMMKAGAVATAVSVPIIAGIKKAMSAYEVQNAAETKLTEIYKTRMGATKAAAQETMKLASALQKEGVVGDEVALSGAQQLATFAKYPGTVNALMPAMENLLVQQKGLNGTAQDATQIANLMGKVMQGQTGALKRVGVSFTEAQEKVLKYGTEEERAAMLSKVITDNVGNMNKAMLATPEGKIQQMKNSLGDLAEQLGAAVAPAIASIAQFISQKIIPKVEKLLNFVQAHPAIGKVIVGITGVLAVGGPLLILIGGLMTKMGAIRKVLGLVTGKIGLIVAAVGALVGAFSYAYKNNEQFRNAVDSLVKTLSSAFKPVLAAIAAAFKAIVPVVKNLILTLASSLVPVIRAMIPVIRTIIGVVASIAKTVIPVLVAVIKKIVPIIQAVVKAVAPILQGLLKVFSTVFGAIVNVVVPIFKKVFNAISVPVKAALSVVKTVVSAIKSLFNFAGIKKTVEGIFNGVKEKIWKPIQTAKDKISGIIDKIKKWFPIDVGKLITFTLPEIGKKYTKSKAKGGGSIGQFSFYVKGTKRYATGAIFPRPTLLPGADGSINQIAEHGTGGEAVLPLNTLWSQLDKRFSRNNKNVTVYNYFTVNGTKDPEEYVRQIADAIERGVRES